MYTSASNYAADGKFGYVHFLKECVEHYCGCRNIYDKVLHRNNVIARTASCGATIKDLANALLTSCQRKTLVSYERTKEKYKLNKYVNAFTKNVFMVDDKPHNIKCRSGKAIGVSSYDFEGHPKYLVKCISSVRNLKKKLEFHGAYDNLIKESYENYKKYLKHKDNKDFINIIKHIQHLYA